ncbi:MAG TPA: DNA-binding response regulator [Actinobacteria bacterium]|nr:DNA-binding response regulator [Actinomycetota bacterium]
MEKIRVLIADDHTLVREGLRAILELAGDVEVVGEAKDGEEAVQKTRELTPDIVLMDIKMPNMDGLEATRLIKKELPQVNVVMLTMYADDEYAREAIKGGATGYVLKNTPRNTLLEILRGIHRGEAFIQPEVTKGLLEEIVRPASREKILSDREREILQLMADGLTNKEIAKKLFIGLETVKSHARNIFAKLEVSDRAQAVAKGLREHLLK